MINDVVVVGGGPNGLLLACELKLAGANPIVLERLSQPSDRPKANGLVGQVVRMLDYRGLYERFSGSRSESSAVAGRGGSESSAVAGRGARSPVRCRASSSVDWDFNCTG
jgi:2-polyprenyl-6-methoxyphenol hydroxylase-like FAD-dependent oxidoreductase